MSRIERVYILVWLSELIHVPHDEAVCAPIFNDPSQPKNIWGSRLLFKCKVKIWLECAPNRVRALLYCLRLPTECSEDEKENLYHLLIL